MPGPVSAQGALAFRTKVIHFYAQASPKLQDVQHPGPCPTQSNSPASAPPPHLSPSVPWGQLQGADHTPRPRGTEWLWTSFCPLSGLPAHTPFREPAIPRPPAPGDRASLYSPRPLPTSWPARGSQSTGLTCTQRRPALCLPLTVHKRTISPKHTRTGESRGPRACTHTGCTLKGHEHCQVDLGPGPGGPPLNALRCDSLPNQHHRNGRWQQASKCRLPGTRSQDPAGISPQPCSDAPVPQKVWAGWFWKYIRSLLPAQPPCSVAPADPGRQALLTAFVLNAALSLAELPLHRLKEARGWIV